MAHGDHALRACYAAQAMQAAMLPTTEDVRRTQGLTLQMRVEINAGEVVVRAIGNDLHMDCSAVGLTMVVAAHMEQLATPGSIWLPVISSTPYSTKRGDIMISNSYYSQEVHGPYELHDIGNLESR